MSSNVFLKSCYLEHKQDRTASFESHATIPTVLASYIIIKSLKKKEMRHLTRYDDGPCTKTIRKSGIIILLFQFYNGFRMKWVLGKRHRCGLKIRITLQNPFV